ncbi:MAG: tetratricopeptide repeat protein [Candidatus Acidiferrum sp.]
MARLPKLICVLLTLLIIPTAVFSQLMQSAVRVSGTVLSEGQNQRILHVVVRLCDSSGNLIEQATTTDSGEFSFGRLQRAPYILTFEAIGFESAEINVDLSFASDRGMTVYLKPVEKESRPASAGATISAHELSMPEAARNLVASGKKKLYADKNPEGGLKDFRQAVDHAPSYYEAYCEMAMAYATMSKVDEAIKSFRKSIEVSRNRYGNADLGLGTLLVEKGDLDAGEKAIRRGIELNPNSWLGFYELGKLDLNRDHLDSALKSAERARALSPNTPIVYRLLSNIHMRQEKYTELLADLDAYIRLDPNSPAGLRAVEIHDQIAQKLAMQGQAAPPGTKLQ